MRVAGEVRQHWAKKLLITKVFVTDGEDVVPVVWYNQPWLKDELAPGRELLLYGKADRPRGALQARQPDDRARGVARSGLPSGAGRSGKGAARGDRGRAGGVRRELAEELPESIRRRYGLSERNFALRSAHFPASREALAAARRRLAFEDLLLYQVALRLTRESGREGVRLDFDDAEIESFWSSLPFAPTGAQRRVLGEIAQDLRSPRAMARLVQGDVGCGKTAIAVRGDPAWRARAAIRRR